MGPRKWPRYARKHRRGLARIVAAKCSQRTTRCTMVSHSFISQPTTHVFVYIHIHVYVRVLFNVFRQIFASKNRMLPRWGKGVDRSRKALRFYCQIDVVAMHFFLLPLKKHKRSLVLLCRELRSFAWMFVIPVWILGMIINEEQRFE